MKSIIALIMIVLAGSAFAQNAEITKKDGQKTEVSIIATSSVAVSIPNGTIPLSDISSVNILEAGQMADRLALYFSKAGIPATINGQSNEAIKQAILSTDPGNTTIKDLTNSIEKFRVQRQTGKGLQLLGLALVSGSVIMQAIYNEQYKKDYEEWLKNPVQSNIPEQKAVSPIISIAGGGLAVIGFVIDLDAGKHLKLKR